MTYYIGSQQVDKLNPSNLKLPGAHLVARAAVGLSGLQVEKVGTFGEEWPVETLRFTANASASLSLLNTYAGLRAGNAIDVTIGGVSLNTLLGITFFVKQVEAAEIRAVALAVNTITSNPTSLLRARWVLIPV